MKNGKRAEYDPEKESERIKELYMNTRALIEEQVKKATESKDDLSGKKIEAITRSLKVLADLHADLLELEAKERKLKREEKLLNEAPIELPFPVRKNSASGFQGGGETATGFQAPFHTDTYEA